MKTTEPTQEVSSANFPDRLPLWQALIYGLGTFGGLGAMAASSLSLPIFNITLGVNVALITTAMGIVQLTGIFLDPLIAHFSDNLSTRWGRRRPLIFVGGIAAGSIFAAMWMFPPGWTGEQYFAWYLVMSLLLNAGNSLYSSGYWALGIEIATDYHERTRITAIRSYFLKIATLIGPWLFFLCQLAIFSSALQGVKWIGAILGGFVIATSVPCAIFMRERFGSQKKPDAQPAGRFWDPVAKFFQTIASIGGNRYFWMLLGVSITLSTGLAIFEAFGNYVNIYYVFGGNTKLGAQFSGWLNTLGVVLAILAITPAQRLCRRLGKHVVVRLTLLWMLPGTFLKWWCYNPQYPYLMFIIPFFYAVGMSSFWLVIPAMQADVVDIDELRSGKRREAMFGAVQNLGFRLSSGIATLLMGLVLNATGFVQSLGGNQSSQTFFWMRMLYSFAMAGVLCLCLVFLIKYDLTASKMEEVRLELERRRKSAG